VQLERLKKNYLPETRSQNDLDNNETIDEIFIYLEQDYTAIKSQVNWYLGKCINATNNNLSKS
jgi:hypothetical protein